MKPTWQTKDGSVKLYHGDCLKILPKIDSIDAIVSDPPYGINFVKGSSGGQGAYRGKRSAKLSRHTDKIHGDGKAFDPSHLLIIEKVLIWGANHYATRLPADSGRWLAWNKLEHLKSFDSFSDVEFAWCSMGKVSRIFNFMWKGGLACRKVGEDNGKRYHPTQKPCALMRWCFQFVNLSDGQTVADPYMGSGSTGVACLRSGLSFIGIELEEKYFDIAVNRINRESKRTRFVKPTQRPSPKEFTL